MEQELLIKVLLSTVLGFLGGWLVKTVFAGGRLRKAEKDWRLQLQAATEARDAAALKVRELRSKVGEMEASFGSVEKDMVRIRDSMEQREQSIQVLRDDLLNAKSKMQEVDQLRAALADREDKLRKLSRVRTELLKNTVQSSELESAKLELETVLQRATQLETENATLAEERDRLKGRAQELTDQQSALIAAARDTRQQSSEQADQTAKISQLESQLKAREQALTQLREDYSELAQEKTVEPAAVEPQDSSPAAELGQAVDSKNRQLAQLRQELEDSRNLLSTFQQKVNQLETEARRKAYSAPTPAAPAATVEATPTSVPPSPGAVPLFYDRPPSQ
ncbi:MAG: hypothetical protein AAF552_17665, partial [Pseudomonadota bacterium]